MLTEGSSPSSVIRFSDSFFFGLEGSAVWVGEQKVFGDTGSGVGLADVLID